MRLLEAGGDIDGALQPGDTWSKVVKDHAEAVAWMNDGTVNPRDSVEDSNHDTDVMELAAPEKISSSLQVPQNKGASSFSEKTIIDLCGSEDEDSFDELFLSELQKTSSINQFRPVAKKKKEKVDEPVSPKAISKKNMNLVKRKSSEQQSSSISKKKPFQKRDGNQPKSRTLVGDATPQKSHYHQPKEFPQGVCKYTAMLANMTKQAERNAKEDPRNEKGIQPTFVEDRLLSLTVRPGQFEKNVWPILRDLRVEHTPTLFIISSGAQKQKFRSSSEIREYLCHNGFGSLPIDQLPIGQKIFLEHWVKYNYVRVKDFTEGYSHFPEALIVKILTDDLGLLLDNGVFFAPRDNGGFCLGSLEDTRAEIRRVSPTGVTCKRLQGKDMEAKLASLRVWAARSDAPMPTQAPNSAMIAGMNARQDDAMPDDSRCTHHGENGRSNNSSGPDDSNDIDLREALQSMFFSGVEIDADGGEDDDDDDDSSDYSYHDSDTEN